MAQAPASRGLVNPENERVAPGEWLNRQTKNWNIMGTMAQCSDSNMANVAVFSEERVNPAKKSSFLFTITCSTELRNARVGIVDEGFPAEHNSEMKADADYPAFIGMFFNKNMLIGQCDDGRTFNLGVLLNGRVEVNGQSTQQAQRENLRHAGRFDLRVDIEEMEARFYAPDVWGDRPIVERIGTRNRVRLAIQSPSGTSFSISHIESRFTLRNEMPVGIDMTLGQEELERLAKKRCKQVVKKIRAVTEVTPINLVVVGEYGSGKSSFINLICTLFTKSSVRPKSSALVTRDTQDQGTRFVKAHTPRKTRLRLIDSIGIAMTEGIGTDINYGEGLLDDLLHGKINDGFSWSNLQSESLQLQGPALKVRAQLAALQTESKTMEDETGQIAGYLAGEDMDIDMMNHGAFVVSSYRNNAGNKKAFRLIKKYRSHHDSYPAVGIVTSLDRAIPDFTIPRMYFNADVSEEFSKARTRMGIDAFPIRCYTELENRQDPLFNLLAAEALEALFLQAVEYKRGVAERMGIDVQTPDMEESSSDEDD